MRRITQHLTCLRALLVLVVFVLAVGLTATTTSAGGYGERLSNGSFEEGFDGNGVGTNWLEFNNGGSAFYHFQDDVSPAFAYDGKHSQLIEVSTMNNFVTEPERYAGIYETVSVAAGTQYTLTMHGMLRVLPDDPDMNNWAYLVQWSIDPNGGTDWSGVTWKDVPWQNTYDWQKPGPISVYVTTFTAPSNKITLFIRALKKFPTRYRDLFVNLDGISLFGQLPGTAGSSGAPQVDVTWPTLVYTTKPFPVHVNASDAIGLSKISLYDNDKSAANLTYSVGPLTKQVDFAWTPSISGTHTLRVEAVDEMGFTTSVTRSMGVVPIVQFLKNGSFESGFVGGAIANSWSFFNNGGRDVYQVPYDDTWQALTTSGQHSQLLEINTAMYGMNDPYQEADRYAGICQVVTGLTPGASYYVTGNGLLRVSEVEEPIHLDDWSYVGQWGYMQGAQPDCSTWDSVSNWQTLPWGHVDYREAPTKINSFTYVIFAPGDTLTVYFRAWKKWAIGAREMLLNFDDLSFAGYQPLPPAPTPTPTVSPTAAVTLAPTSSATSTPHP
jgi:hypothetical protein